MEQRVHNTCQPAVMTQFSFQEKFQPHGHGSPSPLEMESNTLLLKKNWLSAGFTFSFLTKATFHAHRIVA